MMRTISILLTLCLLLTALSGGLTTRAQKTEKPQQDAASPGANKGFGNKLHPQARIGSTPERKAAWDRLTDKEKEKVSERFQKILAKAEQKAQKNPDPDADKTTDTTVTLSDKNGNKQSRPAKMGRKQAAQPLLRLDSAATSKTRMLSKAVGSDASLRRESARDLSSRQLAHGSLNTRATQPRPQAGCWKTIDQFVRDFYLGGLVRQPSAVELSTWVNTLSQAQAQGQEQLVTAARNLGYAIFKSQEYYNRYRGDVDFVHDLYNGWLHREPEQTGWDAWVNTLQTHSRDEVIDGFAYSTEFAAIKVPGLCNNATVDNDFDSLPDQFENQVADLFTPIYHISAGETDNFVTFADQTPQTIVQWFGQTPISHFRVVPAGFAYNPAGQLVSVLRIDYLSLWDHDSGLVGGFFCSGFIGSFGLPLNELGAHNIDNERSATLVAAPVSDYTYNLDPLAYGAYDYLTVSHEDKYPFEHRTFLGFWPPVPAGGHLHLWQSRAKHGTYHFDPDFLPIVDWFVIYLVYNEIDNLYWNGWIDDWTYFSLLFNADTLFYNCVVERFSEQGGQFSNIRINVGEPDSPINGSGFIRSGPLREKLFRPFYQ
jgi:hypothetical protein